MKTILARMQDIKAGKIDEDGMGLNNVETALGRVNIRLRDSATTFRDMGSVLQELSGKWSTLNDIEQENIAKAIAGVRQQNLFRVLMDNMNKALELQKVQYNSTGLAAERYKIYLQGVEAAQNRVTASLEALWQSGISSGLITWVINATADMINFVKAIGGLNTILPVAIILMSVFNAQSILTGAVKAANGIYALITGLQIYIRTLRTGTVALGVYTAAQESALLLTGWGIFVAVIVAAVAGIVYLSQSAQRAAEELDKLNTAFEETNTKVIELNKSMLGVGDIYSEYERLIELVKQLGSVSALTTEDQQKYYDMQVKLLEIMPGLSHAYDDMGRVIVTQTVSMQDLNDTYKEYIRVANDKRIADALASAQGEINARKDLQADNWWQESRKAMLNLSYPGLMPKNLTTVSPSYEKPYDDKIKENSDKLIAQQLRMNETLRSLGQEGAKQYLEAFKGSDFYDELVKVFQDTYLKADYYFTSIFPKIPVKLDTQSFDAEMEKLKAKVSKLDAWNKQDSFSGTELAQIYAEKLSTYWDPITNKTRIAIDSQKAYLDEALKAMNANFGLDDSMKKIVQDFIDMSKAALDTNITMYGVTMRTEDYKKSIEDASQAMWKQSQDNSGAMAIMAINGIDSLNKLYKFIYDGGPTVTTFFEQLSIATGTSINDLFMGYMKNRDDFLQKLVNFDAEMPTFVPTVKTGGKTAEEIRIDNEVTVLEKKKKSLQDQLNDFKKYIDAQKESLKLQKEEADFQDTLAKKHKALSKIKADIALLSLDNSEEARAKRLKLEEEASTMEEDITKTTADRKYQVQVDALDALQKQFEDNINGQIEGIDNTITQYKEQITVINDAAKAVDGVTSSTTDLNHMTTETGNMIMQLFLSQMELSQRSQEAIQSEINKWIDKKGAIQEAYNALLTFATLQEQIDRKEMTADLGQLTDSAFIDKYGISKGEFRTGNYHSGGFVGGVQSNEEYAKLMKGEHVATEWDMNNFMKKVLPRMLSYPSVISNSRADSTSISIPINVLGNLDKTVLPNLKDMILNTINDAMKQRGKMRTVSSFSI